MKILAKNRLKAYYDDEDESGSLVDIAIKKYVHSEMLGTDLSIYIDDAISSYPNKKPMTLYRGLNFLDKESYDKFMKEISNGKLTSFGISSWTTNKSIAEGFARSRKFNLGPLVDKDDPYWKAYQKSSRAHERLVGYKGVVLITHIPAYAGLDMSEAGYPAEAEVVLPKGTYKVQSYDVVSYADKYKDQQANDILFKLIRLGNTNEIKAVFEYLSANGLKPNQLSNYIRHYIFTETVDLSKIKPYASVTARSHETHFYFGVEDKEIVYGSISGLNPSIVKLLNWYTDQDLAKLKVVFRSALVKMLNALEDLADKYPDYPIKINLSVLELANKLDISHSAYALLKEYYKNRYDAIQQEMRNANKIKNAREKQEFIQKHADELIILLKCLVSQ